MERTEKIEEALSIVWEEKEKKNFDRETVRKRIVDEIGEDILENLAAEKYVAFENVSVNFTDKGEDAARDITRRQRLAERLLIDVLELSRREMDSSACEFEHILSKEVEESICTLLGHPKECPHGFPIPPGRCCEKAKDMLESIVVSLSKFSPGETGKIVYVLTRKHPQLHKLMSLGILPGVNVTVHEVLPTFVIQVEETQIALEKDIAKEIYAKKLKSA